jgi:tetratricopeptide (TPR) repeat protein
MRKLWIAGGVALLGAAAAAAWFYATAGPRWTTDSPQALAAYQRGRQAQMKFYFADAREAFEEALAADPSFVVAKLALLESDGGKEERERVISELRQSDTTRLNDRERLMLDAVLARADHDEPRRARRIAEYLDEHPRDPWGLNLASADAWARQELPEAEKLYRRLLEVDPNWLMARNHLGYIAMAQGRFAEAEENFRIYKYVAPDQANPHDSLGELLILLGRYDEARAELEEAVRVRPDFCASYQNLMRITVFARRPEDIDPLVERVVANCPEPMHQPVRCAALQCKAFLSGEYDAPWRDAAGPCAGRLTETEPVTHLMAMLAGRRDDALAIERATGERLAEVEARQPRYAQMLRTLLGVMEGQRLHLDGRHAEAVAKLREVERQMPWWGGDGGGALRLITLLTLARAEELTGDAAASERTLAALRAVNPDFAGWYGKFPPPAVTTAGERPTAPARGS